MCRCHLHPRVSTTPDLLDQKLVERSLGRAERGLQHIALVYRVGLWLALSLLVLWVVWRLFFGRSTRPTGQTPTWSYHLP